MYLPELYPRPTIQSRSAARRAVQDLVDINILNTQTHMLTDRVLHRQIYTNTRANLGLFRLPIYTLETHMLIPDGLKHKYISMEIE